jgi:pimeloyl-ACP methyl ester carboxylesterase
MRRYCVRLNVVSVCLIGFFISAYAPSAGAQSYTFKTIDDPNAAGSPPFTVATGINDLGVIVGRYGHLDSSDPMSAFQYSDGNFSTIDFPGACCGNEALGINNSGVVVGDYNDDIFIHGYVLFNGNYSTLDFPGAVVTTPFVINNHGIIVGQYQNADASFHGFTYNGNFSTFDCPTGGAVAAGINDRGDKVEGCSNGSFEITAAGQITPISFPGASSTFVKSINNSGQIVGIYCTSSDNIFNPFPCHGFVLFNGNYQSIDFPGSMNTFAGSINNLGQIVGQYEDTSRQFHGFLATQAELVDPVPDLLSGPAVISLTSPLGAQTLASKGRTVQGVAADGVTEVVVRIPAVNIGDQFNVSILNDQTGQQSTSANEDGALGNPGDTTFSQPQVAVTAVATTDDANNPNPMAFAVYRAPIDFARPTSGGGYKSGSCINSIPPGTEIFGGAATDDQSACRTVTISIQQNGPNFTTGPSQGININLPVFILRPPVILIHGLWGSWRDWDNFKPLVGDAGTVDSRFSVGRINYDNNIFDSVQSTDPVFTFDQLKRISSNSLGFVYNAHVVQPQIEHCIEEFKSGANQSVSCPNPLNVPVAAVQADIVGHSMGGLIARTIAGLDTFLGASTFAQGDIHKLITIDTPHLGSPVATDLLSPPEHDGCLQNVLASSGFFPLNLVFFGSGSVLTPPFSGAVADLEGDDTTGALSSALAALNAKAPHPLPTALIAGIYENFAALDFSIIPPNLAVTAHTIRADCAGDPLAGQLTSTSWPLIFHGNANDAVVSEISQLAGLGPSSGFGSLFQGYVHSSGVEELGFSGPSVLDPGNIPLDVIFLLNKPWPDANFYILLAP